MTFAILRGLELPREELREPHVHERAVGAPGPLQGRQGPGEDQPQ